MALQKRVSELPAVSQVAGTDLLIVSSNNATKRTTVQQIGAYFQANGVAGPVGPAGAAGAAGVAASVSVGTVTTGAPGSSASVVNAGTSSAAVLNFTIPAGSTGATGPQGPVGPAGTTSWNGITDKPSTFAPSAHTHDDRYYTESEVDTLLAGKQAAGSYAASTHTHVAANISDFTSAVIAAAPPTTNASLLTSGTLPDARLSSNIARTSDVTSAVAAVVNAAPASLDTLKELADALGNDASFASTVTNALAAKAPINNPTFTGTVSGVTKAHVGLSNVPNVDATARANHTGTQAISTIVDLQTALDGKAAASHTHSADDVFVFEGSFNTNGQQNTSVYQSFENVAGSLASKADATHVHGNITAAGRIGTTSGQIVVTTTGGLLTTAATIGASQVSGLGSLATQSSVAYSSLTGTPSTFAPTAHKSSHATGGTDALTPADIGAASVSHTHSASDLTSGTVATARLGSGTASASNFLRGDGTWAAAGSTSASDLTSGTLAEARLSANARQAIDNLLHPFLLAGM